MPRPIPNSYWATAQVLACEYPGDLDKEKARMKLTTLLEAGITDFIDLTEEDELIPYESMLRALAAEQEITITYQRFPIEDLNVPDQPTLEAVLAGLTSIAAAGRKAAVHCWGGIGRTGTVIGCYLVRAQQLSGVEALAHIAQEWEGVAKRHRAPRSPETAAQWRLVEEFR